MSEPRITKSCDAQSGGRKEQTRFSCFFLFFLVDAKIATILYRNKLVCGRVPGRCSGKCSGEVFRGGVPEVWLSLANVVQGGCSTEVFREMFHGGVPRNLF